MRIGAISQLGYSEMSIISEIKTVQYVYECMRLVYKTDENYQYVVKYRIIQNKNNNNKIKS